MREDFEGILEETILLEGGYSNNPSDRGGETYMGITRRHNPDWEGWQIIDRLKALHPHDFKSQLKKSTELVRAMAQRYRHYYWDPVKGDRIPSRPIAKELFDTAVNQGTKAAALYLQQALNLLNRQGKDWPDIEEDGMIGPATLEALDKYLARRNDTTILLIWMNAFQAERYIEIMRKYPEQEAFAAGWVKRLFHGRSTST